MSKKMRYPNGHIGVVSDKVAEILEKRPNHKIVGDVQPKQPELAEPGKANK